MKKRENKIYVVINSLTEKFDIVSDIKEVKNYVEDIKKT